MSRQNHTPESLSRRVVRCSVDWSCAGYKLIDYLAGRFTYRNAAEWCERINAGEIKVNHSNAVPEQTLNLHDLIEYLPQELPEPVANLNYRIVFEDDTLLVVDKPGNLCIHPSGPFFRNTLWHLLCSKYGEIHFINRLDRETSGLLIAAKTASVAAKLQKTSENIKKIYQVIVHGNFDKIIDADGFLFSDIASKIRKKRTFAKELPENAARGESCPTILTPVSTPAPGMSLVKAQLFTGRTHQIRATMFALGYPVAGDKLYGLDEELFLKIKSDALTEEDRKKLVFPRQALHSSELEFIHPASGEKVFFTAPLPEDISTVPTVDKLFNGT